MKNTRKLSALLLALLLTLALALPAAAAEQPPELTALIYTESIRQSGNILLTVTSQELLGAGYALGDVVTVRFLDQSLDIPFCKTYAEVDAGATGLFIHASDDRMVLSINMGNFASTYGIADKTTYEDGSSVWNYRAGVEGPVSVTISLQEAGGYYGEYLLRQLQYTDNRADYPQLTDAEFANFRAVATTGMGENTLYRTASPISPARNRNTYADSALRAAGVTVVMNMSDDEATARAYEGFDSSYYSTVSFIALNMGMDFTDSQFRVMLAKGLRFFAENPGVYAIHCKEGKDRTGFVCGLLECLMGAGYEEVVADYMVSYSNFYGFTPEEERYAVTAQGNIVKNLQRAFQVSDLKEADLAAEAEAYILELGLTDGELAALKANLAVSHTAPAETAPVSTGIPETPVETAAASAEAAFPVGGTYTVVQCDCLWALAERFYGDGRLFGRIAQANGIQEPYVILIGQELTIPAP